MGEVQDVPVGLDEGVVGPAREVEHHLVNFGIAVAAHSNDASGQAVEQRDRLFRRVAFRQVVARAVVQQVAQQDDAVGRFGFDAVDERAHGGRRAVQIGCDEQLHRRFLSSVGPQPKSGQ